MTTGDSSVPSSNDVAGVLAAYAEHSPFASHVGLRTEIIEPDHVRLALPFRDANVTVGDVEHGESTKVAQGLITYKPG